MTFKNVLLNRCEIVEECKKEKSYWRIAKPWRWHPSLQGVENQSII